MFLNPGKVLSLKPPHLSIIISKVLSSLSPGKIGCMVKSSLKKHLSNLHKFSIIPNRPYIYSRAIVSHSKEQLRCSVPQSNHSSSVLNLIIVRIKNSGQSKVCYLHYAIFTQKDVPSFDVSMKNMLFVHVSNSLKHLFHYALLLCKVKSNLHVYESIKVVVNILKDQKH